MVQGEDGKEAFVLNGTAGKQTIKVKLTDDDASKNKTVAQLFLNTSQYFEIIVFISFCCIIKILVL